MKIGIVASVTELSPAQNQLSLPTVPSRVWKHSERPLQANIVRFLFPVLLMTAALLVPSGIAVWLLLAAAVASFFLIPWLIDNLLRYFSQRVAKADAVQASLLLNQLRNHRGIQWFAPAGWKSLQEARLQLKKNDATAAALAFAETARRMKVHVKQKQGIPPELISIEAHAWILAGDYSKARELLLTSPSSPPRSLLDELNWGIALLPSPSDKQEALTHLQRVYESIGGHPRILAALAVALERNGQPEQALEMLQSAQVNLQNSPDEIAEDLLKRAQKGLRNYLLAEKKRQRKAKKAELDKARPVKKQRDDSTKGRQRKDHKGSQKKVRKEQKKKSRKVLHTPQQDKIIGARQSEKDNEQSEKVAKKDMRNLPKPTLNSPPKAPSPAPILPPPLPASSTKPTFSPPSFKIIAPAKPPPPPLEGKILHSPPEIKSPPPATTQQPSTKDSSVEEEWDDIFEELE